jgi:hypothetical protein
MNRVSKSVVLAASLVMTGTAFAEEPAPGGEGEAKPAPPAGGAAVGVGVEAGVVTKANWPLAGIERPLTAAKSMIELSPTVTFAYTDADAEGLNLGFRYGISDKLEVLAAYQGIRLNPNAEFKGGIVAGIGFNAIKGAANGKLDLAIKAALGYDLNAETAVILAGPDVRYKLTPKMFIGTPQNTPGLVFTLKGVDVPMVGTVAPAHFIIPFAFGFQATPKVQLQAITQLVQIKITDSANTSIADATPLLIDGLIALSNKMDVRVQLNLGDLQGLGDLIGINAGINFRL